MTKFTKQNNNINTIIDDTGQVYTLSKQLSGRGQEGFAAFYKSNTGNQIPILIKVDDACTCVMEGSANFVTQSNLIPKQLADTTNYAQVGLLCTNNGVNNDKTFEAISIQNQVLPNRSSDQVVPLDEIVYKEKRKPNTIFSAEYRYADKIKKNFTNMLPTTQWQLAGGIFASNVVGDESLHLGQFMGIMDEQQNLIAIKRIDLGARERYAIARIEEKQINPYHNSKQYAKSGQFGKDYIDFLLSAEDVKRKYTLLWSLLDGTEIHLIAGNYSSSLKDAINSLSEDRDLTSKAYEGILATIKKDILQPSELLESQIQNNFLDQNIEGLAKLLGQLAQSRAISMHNIASNDLEEIFKHSSDPKINKEEFIKAYKNNNFELIDDFIQRLASKEPQSIENVNLILYMCDTAVLMSMDHDYEYKQGLYLDKLKEYQITLAILKFVKNASLSREIINDTVIKDLINIVKDKYNYRYNSEQLAEQNLWNELFNYGLQQKNEDIIKEILDKNINTTKFGIEDSSTNSNGEKRTEGALLLAIKSNNYKILLQLLEKRENQHFASSNILAHTSKTIGSIDRKDENHENVFHHLFKNWNDIPQQINKRELLEKLLKLLVKEKTNKITSGTSDIASIFNQQNKDGKTPLHILIENGGLLALKELKSVIENLPSNSVMGSRWDLAHFIEFDKEAEFKKNFLDYAYEKRNIEMFNDLIQMIKFARDKKLLEPTERNKLLCSDNSPLNDEEKKVVLSKDDKPRSSMLGWAKSSVGFNQTGKNSFDLGVTFWQKNITSENNNRNRMSR